MISTHPMMFWSGVLFIVAAMIYAIRCARDKNSGYGDIGIIAFIFWLGGVLCLLATISASLREVV